MNLAGQEQLTSTTNCVHVMKVSNGLENEFALKNCTVKDLDEQVEKILNLDSVGILQDETSVFDDNGKKIEFINGRYQAELPFKEGHPMKANY